MLTWTLALALLLTMAVGSRADQYDTLRQYWQNFIIANGTSGTAGSVSSQDQSGRFLVNGTAASISATADSDWTTMNTSPSSTHFYIWSDLPLGSVSANITDTFDRLQMMALAWATPGSSLNGNASLASAIGSALDWLNANVYATTGGGYNNWYDWEIGAPESLNNTEVLMYPVLTGTEIANYCAAVDRFAPGGSADMPGGWMNSANTSDMVLAMTIRGILGKSSAKLSTAQTELNVVLPYVTKGDGFYADGSFVFHNYNNVFGAAYNGHYGMVLLGDVAELTNLLLGSTWQITNANLSNAYSWVVNSYEPLIYNGAMMDMVRGRAISWSYETESIDGAAALSEIGQIAQFAPAATANAMLDFVNAPRLPSGQFDFGSMDRVLALRNGFGFGISMSSTRIQNYEVINNGNLHGWFTGDGMTYLYIGNTDNNFNGDYWPTVDPYSLPGTTVETYARANAAGENQPTTQNWVGGAQVAGTYGVAGMSLAAYGTTLTAKKSWFMFDNEVVCLGAGITCADTSGTVNTIAENRRLGTPVTSTFTLNGATITPTPGWSATLSSTSPSWCALSGVGGYYFPAGATGLQAAIVSDSGSWSAINTGDLSTALTDNYLKLWFSHGLKPTNASYAYVLLPGMNAASVSNYALNPDITILANTATVQAVKKPVPGAEAANFWTSAGGTADLITVSNSSSVIVSENANSISVGVSDPTQSNTGTLTVTLNRAATGLLEADSGVTVKQLTPEIILSVNVNGSLGKSFQASFRLPSFVITPTITGGSNMVISYPTRYGYSYQVVYKNKLTDASWSPLGTLIAGDNTVKSITDPVTNSARFYEVQAQ